MCRTYTIYSITCGHHDLIHDRVFICPNPLRCGPLNIRRWTHNDPCSSCFAKSYKLPNSLDLSWELTDCLQSQIRRLLNYAAAPGKRHKVWVLKPDAEGKRKEYVYDSLDENVFSGSLEETTAILLGFMCYNVGRYILDPTVPELTGNEMRLFRQISLAVTEHNINSIIRVRGSKIAAKMGQAEIMDRIHMILTPESLPNGTPDCPICLEPLQDRGRLWQTLTCWQFLTLREVVFGCPAIIMRVVNAFWQASKFWQLRENAVSLPCGHVFGKKCIEACVSTRVPEVGSEFLVCPLCRKRFDLLSPKEREGGFGVLLNQETKVPPAGMWFEVALGAYYGNGIGDVE